MQPYVLDEAKLNEADVLVAATGDDEDNLVSSLLAKQEFAVPRVVARVNHPRNEWMFTEQWGVDAAVSPPHILTAMVEEAVTVGDVVRLLKLERGQVTLVERTLRSDAAMVGHPMYDSGYRSTPASSRSCARLTWSFRARDRPCPRRRADRDRHPRRRGRAAQGSE